MTTSDKPTLSTLPRLLVSRRRPVINNVLAGPYISACWFLLVAACVSPAWAVTPLIYYTRYVIAASPELKKFAAAMEYVKPPEGGDRVSHIVPTDSSCGRPGATYPGNLLADEARRFVDDRSVAGSLEILGSAHDPHSPLSVQLRSGEPPWKFIREGETMTVYSLRGQPITLQVRDQQVIVGGYRVNLDFNGFGDDGWVLVVDGCGNLS